MLDNVHGILFQTMIKQIATVIPSITHVLKNRHVTFAILFTLIQLPAWAQQTNVVDPCMAELRTEQSLKGPVTVKNQVKLSSVDPALAKYWKESTESTESKIRKVETQLNSKKQAAAVTYVVEPCEPGGGGGTPCSIYPPLLTVEEASRCGAGLVTLSASPGAGGNVVYWYEALNDASPFSSGNSVEVYVTQSRAYYLSSYNTTTGCESTRMAMWVSISAPPLNSTITANTLTVCLGQPVKISSSGGVGIPQYSCSNNGGTTWNIFSDSYSGYATFNYTPGATGTYRFRVRNSNDCGFCTTCPESFVDVTVVTPPVLTITHSAPGIGQGEIIVTGSLTTGYTYQWFLNDIAITGENSVTCVARNSGNYKAEASNTGCRITSAPLAITVPNSNNYNYVVTNSINKSGVTSLSQVNALTASELQQSISYLDGQGRIIQKVITQGSPLNQDVVTLTAYDNVGRTAYTYLPYVTGNTGGFKVNAPAAQTSFYQSLKSDNRAFSETKYENSPQSRVTEVVPEGAQWLAANKKQTTAYLMNVANEVRMWNFNSNTKTASGTTYYAANKLFKTEYKDEENFATIEYKDKSGKLVCIKNARSATEFNTTYHVYDDFGNLRFIISPEAEANLGSVNYTISYNDSFCQRWLFAYDYDKQFRPAQQSVPGGGITYMVYDRFNRVVLAQDAKMRTSNQWLFTKYDVFSRTIMKGIYRHGASLTQTEMQQVVDAYYFEDASRKPFESRSSVDFAAYHGYSNQSFPVIPSPNNDNGLPFQISYYDDYDFDNNGTSGETGKGEPAFINFGGTYAPAHSTAIRGMGSGNRIRVVGTSTWLTSAVFYDNKGQTIQIQNENHSTGARNLDVTSLQYDFSGELLNSELRHHMLVSDNTFSLAVKERQTYDRSGRLVEKFSRINDEPEERIVSFSYNEIGEAVKKIMSNSTGLQSVDYRYNIRGWLANINGNAGETGPSDYYTEQLAYNVPYTGGVGLFDGKVKQAKWKTDLTAKERLYDFDYDGQNRIAGAVYKMNSGAGWISDPNLFTENNFTYDKNGNIKTVDRYSGTSTANKIDELSYQYGQGGNQLMKVSDNAPLANRTLGFKDGDGTGDDYAYDENGNLTKDLNKQISNITYNVINLADRITFTNGSYIQYTYSADGEKLSQIFFNATNGSQKKTEYQGGFVYEDGNLQVILHDEGRIVPASYTNLISNTATAQAGSQEGFTVNGLVSLTSESLAGQNYVKAVCNQATGTPGLLPIGGTINVKAGERYAFKALGFQSVGTDAKLVVKNASTNADIVWPGATLPAGQSNETWVTTTFTIPAGVTQVKLGIFWNAGALNKAYYVNEVKLYKLDYEFQYFLTDHVGSPRVVLQTNPATLTFTATMEGENLQNESAQFFNLRPANEVVFAGANATPGGNEVLAMNANYHVGPSRSFKVMPGDVVDASVMAYYVGGTYTKTPLASMGTYVVAALTGTTSLAVDGINYSYSTSTGANPSFLLSPNQGSSKPSAFLNYILFDDAFRPIEAKSAPLGATAGVLHSVLLPTISVKEAGYLFVYLSYDNDTGGDVFFDDLKILYKEGPVVQLNTYYPFGMTASTWVRDGEFQNRYVYQAKELDENTQLQDFHARQYDGQLGRMWSIDPKSQFASGYVGMGNNPVIGVDPDGQFVNLIIAAVVGGIINWATHGASFDKAGLRHFGVGAIAGVISGGVAAGMNVGIGFAQAGASFGTGFQVGVLSFGQVGGMASLSAVGWTASSSFLSGAAIGGSAGFAGGLLTGTGNGLADGQKFGQALGGGLKEGLIGGVAGGITGGIVGGIDAVKDGRYFWTGEQQRLDKTFQLAGASPNAVRQIGDKDCMIGCTKYIADSKGKNLSEADIIKMYGSAYDPTVGTDMTQGLNNANIPHFSASRIDNPMDIGSQMKLGNPTIIAQSRNHSIVPVKIERWIRGTGANARVFWKTVVMDPASGRFIARNGSIFNYPFYTLFWK